MFGVYRVSVGVFFSPVCLTLKVVGSKKKKKKKSVYEDLFRPAPRTSPASPHPDTPTPVPTTKTFILMEVPVI